MTKQIFGLTAFFLILQKWLFFVDKVDKIVYKSETYKNKPVFCG
jgi:hypothetical protein